MKRPWIWFAPIYGLLLAIVLSQFYLGHVTSKSSKQKQTSDILAKINNTILPGGKYFSYYQEQTVNEQNHILYCMYGDAVAAVSHSPAPPGCDGTKS